MTVQLCSNSTGLCLGLLRTFVLIRFSTSSITSSVLFQVLNSQNISMKYPHLSLSLSVKMNIPTDVTVFTTKSPLNAFCTFQSNEHRTF